MKNIMKILNYLALFGALFVLGSCEEETAEPACSIDIPSEARVYEFAHRGSEYTYRAWTTDSAVIARVEAQLALPEADRMQHINGEILEQPAGCDLNPGWSWYFNPAAWDLADISIEVCDGNPQYVEDNLQDFLDINRYCPWSSYVLREVDQS
jgi:hypothetical protein